MNSHTHHCHHYPFYLYYTDNHQDWQTIAHELGHNEGLHQ